MLIDSEKLTFEQWFDVKVALKIFLKDLEEIIELSDEKDGYSPSREQKKSIENFLELIKEVV